MKLSVFVSLLIVSITVTAQQVSEPSFSAFSGVLSSNGNTVIASVGDLITDELGNDEISLGGGVETLSVVILNVDEEIDQITYKVYPNPTTDRISISNNKRTYQNISLSIIDNRGSLMHTQLLDKENNKVDVRSLKTGIYFLQIMEQEEEKIITIKLIKE